MTVLERLITAWYSEDAVRAALASGRVHVDSVRVIELDTPIADGAFVIEKLSD